MKTRLFKGMVILGFVVSSLVVGTMAFAQSPFAPPQIPFDAVLAKLDQIIDMLAPPDTPAPGPVTLSTGLVRKGDLDTAYCVFTNLSAVTIPKVRTVMLGVNAETLSESALDVPPGRGFSVVFWDFSSYARCEFSFVGFADDVRATLVINDSNDLQPLVALDAR